MNYYYKNSSSCSTGASGNNGQIQCITDNMDNGRTVAYTYDALGRLSKALTAGSSGYPQWGFQWTYDRYGNRTAQTATAGSNLPQPSVTVSATTNQITSTGYAYDASGNATNDGFNTLAYDSENHAVSVSNTVASAAYTYDAHGLRVQKAVTSGTTTVYIFSGSKVIAEYDNGAAVGSPSREYIYSGGALLAKIESSATVYYHPDGLSSRIMTDSSGNVITQQGHYPFGELWYPSSALTKWLFTTYERDSESGGSDGNDYAMARYYRDALGRFDSPDPLSGSTSDPQSLNRYSYSRNDPIDRVDPSGLCDAVVGGFTQTPGSKETSGQEQFANQIGADLVYPFSGENAVSSYLDAQFGSLGEEVTLNGVMDAAAQSGNQPFNIYTFSGGFQEVANIWTLLPSNVQQSANIISIDPGRVPFGADLPNATVFQGDSSGNSLLTALGPSGTTINLCGHDANCMFGILQLDGFIGPNGNGLQVPPKPCPNKKVFTRKQPQGISQAEALGIAYYQAYVASVISDGTNTNWAKMNKLADFADTMTSVTVTITYSPYNPSGKH